VDFTGISYERSSFHEQTTSSTRNGMDCRLRSPTSGGAPFIKQEPSVGHPVIPSYPAMPLPGGYMSSNYSSPIEYSPQSGDFTEHPAFFANSPHMDFSATANWLAARANQSIGPGIPPHNGEAFSPMPTQYGHPQGMYMSSAMNIHAPTPPLTTCTSNRSPLMGSVATSSSANTTVTSASEHEETRSTSSNSSSGYTSHSEHEAIAPNGLYPINGSPGSFSSSDILHSEDPSSYTEQMMHHLFTRVAGEHFPDLFDIHH
jgi:hypothetical protein